MVWCAIAAIKILDPEVHFHMLFLTFVVVVVVVAVDASFSLLFVVAVVCCRRCLLSSLFVVVVVVVVVAFVVAFDDVQLDSIQDSREDVAWWLAERQLECGGFNGRPEKKEDVCYRFLLLAAALICLLY